MKQSGLKCVWFDNSTWFLGYLGMVSWVELNFIRVSYNNGSQLIYSPIGPPTVNKVLQIRSVLLSKHFIGIGSLVFPGTQNGVKGPYGDMTELDLLKKIFLFPQNGENRSNLKFFEYVWKFSYFFLNLVYNGSLY